MLTSRWWIVALAACTVAPLVILALSAAPPTDLVAGAVAGAVYAAFFLVLRRRARDGNAAAIVLTVVTALFGGVLSGIAPILAIVQGVVYPLVWVLAKGRVPAIIASVAVAVAVGCGLAVSIPGPGAWQAILLSQVLSVAFATVMGLWITHIANLGDDKARLLAELLAAQDELAALHRDAGVTQERARMSREVHDTVAQSLTGLVLLAQRAHREHAAGRLDAESLELIETSARDALAETRALVAAAAPVELTQGGLAEALRLLGERFERETRIRVSVSAEVGAHLDRDAEVVLLRCAQEGLANVRKHSNATEARITLSVADGQATIAVIDDGRGFVEKPGPGFGLAGLRDRLALAGGVLAVDGTAGAATLTATLPAGGAS